MGATAYLCALCSRYYVPVSSLECTFAHGAGCCHKYRDRTATANEIEAAKAAGVKGDHRAERHDMTWAVP